MSKDGLRPAIGRIAEASIRGAIEAGAYQTAYELGARSKPPASVAAIASRRAASLARPCRRPVIFGNEIRKLLERQRRRERAAMPSGWVVSDVDLRSRRLRNTMW